MSRTEGVAPHVIDNLQVVKIAAGMLLETDKALRGCARSGLPCADRRAVARGALRVAGGADPSALLRLLDDAWASPVSPRIRTRGACNTGYQTSATGC